MSNTQAASSPKPKKAHRAGRHKMNQLGLYLSPDTVWIYNSNNSLVNDVNVTIPFSNDWDDVFTKVRKQFGRAELSIVLSPEWYQTLQIEKPAVQESEIKQALLWSVKNIITVPVHHLHLDYYESPLKNQSRVVVVLADKQFLKNIVQAAVAADLSINGITIEEMAITNLIQDETQTTTTRLIVSHYPGEEMLFSIVRDNTPYMQRRVRGFKGIRLYSEEVSQEFADSISLEVQRSIDYFENHLRQPPVTVIELVVEGYAEYLAQCLSRNFNQPINVVRHESVGELIASLGYLELKDKVA